MSGAPGTPSPGNDLSSLRVPKALRGDVAEIAALTDKVCAEHLDDEYGALCLRLLGKLARKRPSPLVRGERRVWAAGVLYTVGSINFLFDPSEEPHLRSDELAALTEQRVSSHCWSTRRECPAPGHDDGNDRGAGSTRRSAR